jgi:hypothetical protein
VKRTILGRTSAGVVAITIGLSTALLTGSPAHAGSTIEEKCDGGDGAGSYSCVQIERYGRYVEHIWAQAKRTVASPEPLHMNVRWPDGGTNQPMIPRVEERWSAPIRRDFPAGSKFCVTGWRHAQDGAFRKWSEACITI